MAGTSTTSQANPPDQSYRPPPVGRTPRQTRVAPRHFRSNKTPLRTRLCAKSFALSRSEQRSRNRLATPGACGSFLQEMGEAPRAWPSVLSLFQFQFRLLFSLASPFSFIERLLDC